MDRALWISSAALSAVAYAAIVELLGPGSPEALIPSIPILAGGALVSASNPRAYTGFMKGFQERVVKAVGEAGLYVNPYERARIAAYHVRSLIIFSSISAASLAAAHLLASPPPLHLAALSIAPAAIPPFIGVYLGTFDKVRERRDRAERELPFFTTMAAILSRAGLTIYSALLRASQRADIFPWISWEAKGVRRDVESLGMGVTESIVGRFEKHPSQKLKTMMLTATSVWRTGGDISGTLEAFASQHLRELGDRWDQYGRSVSGLGEMLTIVFLLFPISGGIVAVAFPQYSLPLVYLLMLALTPGVGAVFYNLLRNMSPAIQDRYDVSPAGIAASLAPLALPIAAFLPFAPRAEGLASILAGAGCLMSSLLAYSAMRGQVEEVSQCEGALVSFIRDVAEYRRIGYSVFQALEKCAENPYPQRFGKLVRKAVGRVRMGVKIGESVRDSRSWLTRMAFALLEEVEESGGGSPELLEKVEELLRAHLYSKERARAGVRAYFFLILSVPFIVAFSSALIASLTSALAPLAGRGFGGVVLTFAKESEVKAIMEYTMISSLESTMVMGLLMGKAADQHPFGTWRLAVASLSFIAASAAFPEIVKAVGQVFGIGGQG